MVTTTDIANRALQRCGANRIAAASTLAAEGSKNADQVRLCYEIVRRAELRRNVWRFATRKAVLRAIDTTSRQVTFATYSSGTTYAVANVVVYNGTLWQSKVSTNLAHTPADDSDYWTRYFGNTNASLYDSTITYQAGEIVYVTSTAYLSLISGNSDTPPSSNWITLTSATLTAYQFVYPIGAGPLSQSEMRNVYLLPSGFLRQAPDDPPNGSYQPLGAPVGLSYQDYLFEGDFLISRQAGPILFRFCADIADPTKFDPMFVEGFACRIAMEVCEPLTQSSTKIQTIMVEYKSIMGEARTVNGIETGPTIPPEDAYIIDRL